MIPSKDINEDTQSSLNRQSTFQGAQFEPDSSPMRVLSTEGTVCVSLCVRERKGVGLYHVCVCVCMCVIKPVCICYHLQNLTVEIYSLSCY